MVVARGDTIARGNGARRSSARFLHKKRGAQRQEAGSNPVAALRARHAFLAQHALHAPPPPPPLPPPRATYSYTITIFTVEHLISVLLAQVNNFFRLFHFYTSIKCLFIFIYDSFTVQKNK